jgi:hypothetical protein
MKYLLMTLVLLMVAGSAVADEITWRQWDTASVTYVNTATIGYFYSSDDHQGGCSSGEIWRSSNTNYGRIILRFPQIEAIPQGDSVVHCSLYVRVNDVYPFNDSGWVGAYRLFKPTHFDTATCEGSSDSTTTPSYWLWGFSLADRENWSIYAADSADDAGVDNQSDGDGADRTATAVDSLWFHTDTVNWDGVWLGWDITSLMRRWHDSTYANNGLIILAAHTELFRSRWIRLSEARNENERPYVVIEHTDGGAAPEPTGTIRGDITIKGDVTIKGGP